MTELKRFEEKKGASRAKGVEHGVRLNRQNWLERKTLEAAALGTTKQPYCLIIGGGQGGIILGARLKRLKVPTIIIEKNNRPGDSWRNRYKSLCLHDPFGTTICPTYHFQTIGPYFLQKTRSLTGWRCMRTSWS
jgi:putative flavoprotein involved in K+ transport